MGGIVVPTEVLIQIGELAGGIGNGVLGRDLGSGLIGGTHQGFQILSETKCKMIL